MVGFQLKICHVVSTLDIGGIERWLFNVASQFSNTHSLGIQSDFVTLLGRDGKLTREFGNLGCSVNYIDFAWDSIFSSVWNLTLFLREAIMMLFIVILII